MRKKVQIRAVLVDDQEDSLLYADRLTDSGLLCEKLKPLKHSQDLVSAIRNGKYDVVLLDYRLDDTNEVSYRGGTIAAQLKEALPNLPVVLLTSEAKLRQSLEHNPQIYGLFDLRLLKEDLRRPAQWQFQATRIRDLAIGYQQIATGSSESSRRSGDNTTWNSLAELLGANQSETETLPQFCQGPAPTRTTEVARWLYELRSFPGLLLDAAHVRVLFGLTESSFQDSAVQKALQKARYAGVFSKLEQRWWRARVSKLLQAIAGAQAMGISQHRVVALSTKVKKRLEADCCVVCQGGMIDRVCHLCQSATDSSHVVRAVVDARPAWAEPPLVCFQCIRTGVAEQVRFASGTEGLVEELRGGRASGL